MPCWWWHSIVPLKWFLKKWSNCFYFETYWVELNCKRFSCTHILTCNTWFQRKFTQLRVQYSRCGFCASALRLCQWRHKPPPPPPRSIAPHVIILVDIMLGNEIHSGNLKEIGFLQRFSLRGIFFPIATRTIYSLITT